MVGCPLRGSQWRCRDEGEDIGPALKPKSTAVWEVLGIGIWVLRVSRPV